MGRCIPVPGSISERSNEAETLIVCQWDRNPIMLGIFTVIYMNFIGFFIFWFHKMLGDESFLDWIEQPDWMAKLTLESPLLLFAICGAYCLLATFLNHTNIQISGSDLKIRIRPIPWIGDKTVKKLEITQLFVREKTSKDSYGQITKSYQVHWINTRGQRLPLVGRLRVHEALYLENRLEEILGIENQPVSGAYTGYEFYV